MLDCSRVYLQRNVKRRCQLYMLHVMAGSILHNLLGRYVGALEFDETFAFAELASPSAIILQCIY